LAIVRGVADRWGGSVLVESVPGRTVFTLAFPVADEEVHALAG
jgi:signal transduction histidine kinase